MKESAWGYVIITLGVIIMAIIFFVQRLTTTNEEEYYLNREIVHSAMIDAVDYSALHGDDPKLVMIRDKFVELFTRRFAESVTLDKSYQLDFYQIVEEPPSATVRIRSYSGATNIGTPNNSKLNVAVDNTITAVLIMDDDGKVKARPPEMDEFKPEIEVFFKLTLNTSKVYTETKDMNCAHNCDSGNNVRKVTRKYNFFEILDDDDAREDYLINTDITHYQQINFVKVKYASDINLVNLKISDFVRYNREHIVKQGYLVYRSLSCPVYLLYRPNEDVYSISDDIEYIVINFSLSFEVGGKLEQTYEVIYKPKEGDYSQWIPVDEYRVS